MKVKLKKALNEDSVQLKLHNVIIQKSNEIINLKPLAYEKVGIRLLDVSRESILRIFYLSYSYRLTGDIRFSLRAEKEMLAVADFPDWNPTHFLDVAEMAMSMAIGYDWLYDKLSVQSRAKIVEAIKSKAVEPFFDERYNAFSKAKHNWNQVCNTGVLYGALAIADKYPDLTEKVIRSAIQSIPLSMNEYKPVGAHPEGFNYWDYGTTYNVFFLDVLQKAFNSDFGLLKNSAFLKTGEFYFYMTSPSGLPFNWGDCPVNYLRSDALIWFADKTKNSSLLWFENRFIRESSYEKLSINRFLPAALVWGKNIRFNKISAPKQLDYIADGKSPVAIFRTSFNPSTSIFLAIKGGSPRVNHSHMDGGTFVMESNGIRWASDFGMQSYESLESNKLSIWSTNQDSDRWRVLRLNNHSHNVLTVNNQLHLVNGDVRIIKHSVSKSFKHAVVDMISIFGNTLSSAKRGVAIANQKYVIIQDELIGGIDKSSSVRWNMLTEADVEITSSNTATLMKNGKKLYLKVVSPQNVVLQTRSTTSVNKFDASNLGTVFVGFDVNIPPGESKILKVELIPEDSAHTNKMKLKSLNKW